MTKEILKNLIITKKFTQEELLRWIANLPEEISKYKPRTKKVGDVFFHNGFNHPCVLARKNKDGWNVLMMTSEKKCKEIVSEAKSRFSEGFFTYSLVFVNDDSLKSYLFHYEDKKHLKSVYQEVVKRILT